MLATSGRANPQDASCIQDSVPVPPHFILRSDSDWTKATRKAPGTAKVSVPSVGAVEVADSQHLEHADGVQARVLTHLPV